MPLIYGRWSSGALPDVRALARLVLNCKRSTMSACQEMWQWTAGAFPAIHELAMLLTWLLNLAGAGINGRVTANKLQGGSKRWEAGRGFTPFAGFEAAEEVLRREERTAQDDRRTMRVECLGGAEEPCVGRGVGLRHADGASPQGERSPPYLPAWYLTGRREKNPPRGGGAEEQRN